MKKLLIIFILLSSFGWVTITIAGQTISENEIKGKNEKLLEGGIKKLTDRSFKESIDKYFDPIIQSYSHHYGNNGKRMYCSRNSEETLFYLLDAAIAISQVWAQAYYYKGYAYIELGNIEAAKTNLKKALELSPSNSVYLAELGYIYVTERKLSEALELYDRAEEFANMFTPEGSKNAELMKVLHGSGYILIELGRLDEAEKKYRKCLKIDANDQKALNELKYIKDLRNKKIPNIICIKSDRQAP